MVSCSVPGCEVTRGFNPNKYTFHSFPRNPALFEKWMRIVNRPDWTPSKNSTICSKHFDGNCFIQRKHRRVLMKDTIPTLFVPLRSASTFGRVRVLAREFAGDVRSLWKYGAPFPTFLKLIGTLILCLMILLPLVYPLFVAVVTYFTYESLFLSWRLNQPWRFMPLAIARRALSAAFAPTGPRDIWKVREVLTRGILLAHSLATSVDYLCVMQGLLDET